MNNLKSFHKYSPAAIWLTFSAKFGLEKKVKNWNFWKMSNIAVFHISVALNINFNSVKNS